METLEKTNNLKEQVLKILAQTGLTQTALSKQMGYSASALNTYLKDSYKGNIVDFEKALAKFLKQFKANKNRLKTVLNFALTSVAKNIFNVASLCQYNGEIGVCFGASGLGKTTAIKEYRQNNNNVIYVDPDENASPRAILKQIATQLKIVDFSQYMEVFTDDIVKRLYGTGAIIIIDEAENLNSKMFRMLRKIHDRCDGTIAILFVGTEVLYSNLIKLQGEYNYVVNRIAVCSRIDSLNSNDIRMLVTQIFPDADDELVQYFEQQTNNNARILYNTLKRAKDIVTSSGAELDKDIIKSARGYLLATNYKGVEK